MTAPLSDLTAKQEKETHLFLIENGIGHMMVTKRASSDMSKPKHTAARQLCSACLLKEADEYSIATSNVSYRRGSVV